MFDMVAFGDSIIDVICKTAGVEGIASRLSAFRNDTSILLTTDN
jgi:hypothetical protein